MALEKVGVCGQNLKWFYSYLKDRSQYVEVNGRKSEEMSIQSGVPQGTVLGPILFTIFINDMLQRSEARTDAVTECFADDAMIYSTATTEQQAATQLNLALNDTAEWITQSDLVLNDKT